MAATYVPHQQYSHWKGRADDLDMSVSEFIKSMVEAGNKKFEATVDPDEADNELREQRNHYKREFERAQSRVSMLENRLDRGERAEIQSFIEANPGASFDEVVQHLIETVPERVNDLLETFEGEYVEVTDGAYYPIGDSEKGDI